MQAKYFTVIRRLHSPRRYGASFGRGEIDASACFPGERFSDKLYTGEARVQLVSDATDPNMATMQAGYAANIISSAGQEMLLPGVHAAAIVPQLKLLYNPQMKSAYNFVPGVMGLILMLICAMMTSISIVREKETGTMEVLLVSPVKPLFHRFSQRRCLFCAVVCQLDHHSSAFSLCARCSRGGQLVTAGGGVAAIHLCLPGAGAADFCGHPDAGCRHAGVRTDADDAHHVAFGHDIPH